MDSEILIRGSNPWWEDPESIHRDSQIMQWSDSTIRHDPALRHELQFDFEPDNTVVYTMRGPRQVGKTTMIKLQIRDFIARGVRPWNILYCSLDLASTPKDLADLLYTYLKISKKHRSDSRTYVFLDEASSVTDWQKGLKYVIDVIGLPNCTVMATGSQSINIKNASERLPGRKGRTDNAYDNVLLPMKFSEYAMFDEDVSKAVRDSRLDAPSRREKAIEKLIRGEIDECLDVLDRFQVSINNLFDEYMITGGIPKIVEESVRIGTISEDTYSNYLDSVTGQWKSLSKNESMLKQFGGALVNNLGKHTSWNSLARDADLGNAGTAQDYADTLHHLFIALVISLYGEEGKRARFRNNRKLYFHDPFFLHLFRGWASTGPSLEDSIRYRNDETTRGQIVEGIVADHLVRWAFLTSRRKKTYDYRDHVFYWKDDKNREVDFVLHDGVKTELPIEVKFRNSIDAKSLAPMVKFLCKTGGDSGLVLSKTSLEARQDYVVVPAPMFLLLV